MRETELWARLDAALGAGYSRVWAHEHTLADLGSTTVSEALAAGVACKAIWRAVWADLDLPDSER